MSDELSIICLTDKGRVRNHNEDNVIGDATSGLLVLADGMGGYQAGEVASEIAVREILNTVSHQLAQHGAEVFQSQGGAVLKQAVIKANQAIYEAAQDDSDYYGMGTTVVSLWLQKSQAYIAHVGDSRLYRLRNNELQQLTVDHSVLQELIEQGFYTQEEARFAPNKNLVTRALGVSNVVDVDIQEVDVQPSDIFLLCSDGLNDMIEDKLIKALLQENQNDLQQAGELLMKAANEAGGEDNISVILATRRDTALNLANQRSWWQRLSQYWHKS
jgi:protein phosphatase